MSIVERLAQHFTRSAPGPAAASAGLPALLRALYAEGGEWHLLANDHFNVFGFNLLRAPLDEVSASVFGDDAERAAWAARRRAAGMQSSCADADWRCFASFSEFDYFFVRKDGAVRHIVNNCDEESAVPGGLEALLFALADAVEARAAGANAGGGAPAEQLCPPLRRMRAAVLDS